jgi:hypothetical protein
MKGKFFMIIVLWLALASESRAVRLGLASRDQTHNQPSRILAGELSADPIDKLETDNFKLLIHGPKRSRITKSFFDFPEAQFMMREQMKKDQVEISSFVKSQESKARPSSNDPWKNLLPKRKRVNRNLQSIKLDSEIEALLPDFTRDLKKLKSKKISRKLLLEKANNGASDGQDKSNQSAPQFTENCSEADRLSNKCQTIKLMPDAKADLTAQKSLETFSKFSQDYQKNVKVSNRSLKKKYVDAYQAKVMKVEQDYQAFLMHVTDEYNRLQKSLWSKDQAKYQKAQKKALAATTASITLNIKKMFRKLDKFYAAKAKVQNKHRKEELRVLLGKMQDVYNQSYEQDQIQANEMVSKLEDERLNKWKNAEKDKTFIENEILQTL